MSVIEFVIEFFKAKTSEEWGLAPCYLAAESPLTLRHGACPLSSLTIINRVGPSKMGTGTQVSEYVSFEWKVNSAHLRASPHFSTPASKQTDHRPEMAKLFLNDSLPKAEFFDLEKIVAP